MGYSVISTVTNRDCVGVCFPVDRDEYFRMKLQWKSISEEQERRNSRLRDYRSLIGEDSSSLKTALCNILFKKPFFV